MPEDLIASSSVAQTTEEHAIALLAEQLGAERIGESEGGR
jgi:hypothetical protein